MKKYLFILFFFCYLPAQFLAQVVNNSTPVTTKFYGFDNPKQDCIPAETYERVKTIVATNMAQLQAEGKLSLAKSRIAPVFTWPLRAANGLDYIDFNSSVGYLDQNLNTGNLDFNCGTRAYDGHRGIDIGGWPFTWQLMEQNKIEVVAAAAGTIIAKEDGHFDKNCIVNNLPANYVIVRHTDGSRALYWHLKNGTVITKNIGETVTKGEHLGFVGSSGSSTAPHLHFEVYDSNNNLIDPFQGNCNNLNNESWWEDQKDYYDTGINALLTHAAVPDFGDECGALEVMKISKSFNPNALATFCVYFHDLLASHTIENQIIKPNGSVFVNWQYTYNQSFGWGVSCGQWYLTNEVGEWTYKATLNNETVETKFYVGVNPPPNPTPQITVDGLTNLCPNQTTTLDAGSGYAVYNWSTGKSTQRITVGQAGNYSVTVTNTANLQGSDTQIIDTNTNCTDPNPTLFRVGPTRTYKVPSEVISLVTDGDIVEIDAGEYPGDVGAWYANNITIRGVGGKAHLSANGRNSQGKAIWVIAGDNYIIENIELSECTVPDENGAGIRHEGTNLTIRNCYFHDNENGILTTNNTNSTVKVAYSEFARNSHSSGRAHNIYINNIKRYEMSFCYFHGSAEGHNVKTRANENYILYNRIMDEANGSSSYLIDIPNGGKTYIVGNLIQQGRNAPNSSMIAYAMEGVNNATQELNVYNNTIVNERGNGYFFRNRNPNPTTKIFNNLLIGGVTSIAIGGLIVNTNENLVIPNSNNAGLTNIAEYNYFLTANASAINQGINPVSKNVEINPTHQYIHPTHEATRTINGIIDMGAYEYTGSTTSPPMPNIEIVGKTTLCPNEHTILDAGSGYTSYSWSTGENTQRITVTTPGDYTVTVNQNGQSGSNDVTIGTNTDCGITPPTAPDADNIVTITEPFGQAVSDYPMQLGRPFVEGEIPNHPQVLVNGTPVLTQANIKTRWEDGSVKHAILNFIIPQIPANGIVELTFQNQVNGHNTGSLTRNQMLESRFNFDATIQIDNTQGSGSDMASAREMLQNGDFEYWLEGEVATSVILTDHSVERQYDMGFDQHRSFRPIFHATFWHALNKVEVRYIGEVINSEVLQDMDFSVTLKAGNTNPQTQYTQDNMTHYTFTRWTKKYWVDGMELAKLNIKHNVAYLASTKQIPNFDVSKVIPESITSQEYVKWLGKSTNFYENGFLTTRMPNTGGRSDLGPYPDWTVRWLYNGDYRDAEISFAQGDLAAAWPYHMREGKTDRVFDLNNSNALGKPVSLYARPTFILSTYSIKNRSNLTDVEDRVTLLEDIARRPLTSGGGEWHPDNAHQPDPYTPQYLLSGEYWYLEESYFLASYGTTGGSNYNSGYRGMSGEPWGGIDGEIRGQGRAFRNRAQTASLAPDGSPEKRYYTDITKHAITYFESKLNLSNSYPEFQALWNFIQTQSDEENKRPIIGPNPLRFWYKTTHQTNSCVEANIELRTIAPWHFYHLLYSLGRAEELGFETTQLLEYAGTNLVGILTSPNFNPKLCASYTMKVKKAGDPNFFQTWEETYNEFCPEEIADIDNRFNRHVADISYGYANVAMASASYLTKLSNGDQAWAFMEQNVLNNPSLNENPKWALLPRIATTTTSCSQTIIVNEEMDNPSYQAAQTITTSGIVNINSNQTMHFKAGKEIILNPGVHVHAGASFSAMIQGCQASLMERKAYTEENYKVPVQPIPEKINESVRVHAYPNPVREVSNIDISLPETSDIVLSIYSPMGQKVSELVNATNQPQGVYQYQWNCSEVQNGVYFLVLNGKHVGEFMVVR